MTSISNEITRLKHQLKKQEDLLKFLLSKINGDNSQIASILSYISMLKNDYGFNAANRDMFKKLILEENILKSYYNSNEVLTKLSNKLTQLTFNLVQGANFYDLNKAYSLNLSGKSVYFEFLILSKLVNILKFGEDTNDILILKAVENDPGSYELYFGTELNQLVHIVKSDKFDKILTKNHTYDYVPVLLEFNVDEYVLYIYTAIIHESSITYKKIKIFKPETTKDFSLLRDAMCYVGLSGIIPDAYKINLEGSFRTRVKTAISLIEQEELNLPYAGYSGISGLQGYSYIKGLAANFLQAILYTYSEVGTTKMTALSGLKSSHPLSPRFIIESEKVFPGNDLIIAGIHDNNDRVYDPNSHQTVCFIPISKASEFRIAYDQSPSDVEIITIGGSDYFDLQIQVNKMDVESKTIVVVAGFVRFKQTVNTITLQTLNSTSNGSIRPISYISCAALNYDNTTDTNDKKTLTYKGSQFGVGFGDILGRKMDGYLLMAIADVTITGQVYIDASHDLSIDPTQGEFTYEFNDQTHTVTSIFEMRKEEEFGVVKTYLASTETFQLELKRPIGIRVGSNDNQKSTDLFITKGDNLNNLIVPYDNPNDMFIYTKRDDDMGVARDIASHIFQTDSMRPYIPNLTCCELVDPNLFGKRNHADNPMLSARVASTRFGWNGMMKSELNTWSSGGYIDERKIEMKCELSYDGWNMIGGKFPEITQQIRHDQNFDTRQFMISSSDELAHVVYVKDLDRWEYQPDSPCNFSMVELTINNVREVSSDTVNNIFDTNLDLSKIDNEIALIFKTQKDIIDRMADMEYKINKLTDLVKKITEVLSDIIKSMEQSQKHSGASIIQDLFNVGLFVLEMFAPELVLFFAPFALLLLGSASLVSGDIEGGIVDLIGAGVIAGYYHIPLYVVPYAKRFLNQYSNFNNLFHTFLTYTTRVGNCFRRYIPGLRGYYDVRANQARLRVDQYTHYEDVYSQRYELVALDLWPGVLRGIRNDAPKKVKSMTITLERVFRVHAPDNPQKLNTIVATVYMYLGSPNIQARYYNKRAGFYQNYKSDASFLITIAYRNKLPSTGLFTYVTLTKDNYQSYISTDMSFDNLQESTRIAILLDEKTSINSITKDVTDFMDGILENLIDAGELPQTYHAVGLIHPHVYYSNLKTTSDILWSALSATGKDYQFNIPSD